MGCMYNTLQSTQKIQCTFKVDIPDMGHLDGGRERDVRTPCEKTLPRTPSHIHRLSSLSDKSPKQDPTPALARLHSHLFVRRKQGSDRRTTGPHFHPSHLSLNLVLAGITRILPSRLRSARASGTRSMPRLRASGSLPWSAPVVFGTGSER